MIMAGAGCVDELLAAVDERRAFGYEAACTATRLARKSFPLSGRTEKTAYFP